MPRVLVARYTHREVWDAFDYYDRGDQQPE